MWTNCGFLYKNGDSKTPHRCPLSGHKIKCVVNLSKEIFGEQILAREYPHKPRIWSCSMTNWASLGKSTQIEDCGNKGWFLNAIWSKLHINHPLKHKISAGLDAPHIKATTRLKANISLPTGCKDKSSIYLLL